LYSCQFVDDGAFFALCARSDFALPGEKDIRVSENPSQQLSPLRSA
jgi:hypothetical protein